MWPIRRTTDNPLQPVSDGPPEAAPPGYRLRRVGPGEWVAEPLRLRLIVVVSALVALAAGGVAGALAARAYYHRSATVLLITVNGTPLRRDELRARLEERAGIAEVVRFASFELSRQFAEARGCWPTDDEVDAAMERERAKPDFLERLALLGLTEDGFKGELRLDLAQTKLLTRDVSVTPEDVRSFYDRNADPNNPAARYHMPDRVQVTAIGSATEEVARQALRDLVAGTPWNKVAAGYSEDPSRKLGGLMPPFARGESVFATNPATERAIFLMRPGDRIGPVPAARKWWVIRCENKWRTTTTPWIEAREDARIGALLVKGVARNRARLDQERATFVTRSEIRIFEEAYGDAQEPDLSRPVRW